MMLPTQEKSTNKVNERNILSLLLVPDFPLLVIRSLQLFRENWKHRQILYTQHNNLFQEIHNSVQISKKHVLNLKSIQASLMAPLNIANENPPPQSFFEQILPVPVHVCNEIT